jgi:hypothetical protein
MKTKLFTLLTALCVSQAVLAQFNIGIKAGTNITKIEGRSFKDEFRYGYHIGGFAEIGFGKKLGIQPEVLFNQFQTRVDSSFKNVYQNAVNFSDNRNIKLNYLSIPVLLNYKLGNALTLQAGPQFGILLDQNKDLLENGQEAFSKGDFSMLGGASLNISKLRLTGRYLVGLNNLNDLDNQNEWKNQGFQLSLGLSL